MLAVAVIPTLNEAQTVGAVIRGVSAQLRVLAPRHEVWVVDDASTDGTVEIAHRFGAHVHQLPERRSLAAVFREAMAIAIARGADVIVHIDGDGQYCPEELPDFIQHVRNGSKLVIGSRFRGKIESMPPLTKIANRLLTRLVSMLAGVALTDAQSGYRVFTKEVAALPIYGTFSYTQAQIIGAAASGIQIVEIPIVFRPRSSGPSRLVRFRPYAGTRMLFDIFATSFRTTMDRHRGSP